MKAKKLMNGLYLVLGMAFSLFFFRDSNKIYILFFEDIGSAVFPLSFLDTIACKGTHVCVITTKKYQDLCNMYDERIDEIKIWNKLLSKCVTRYLSKLPREKLQNKGIFHFYTNPEKERITKWAYKNNEVFSDLSINNIIYSYLFDVGILNKISYGNTDRINKGILSSLIQKYGIIRQKSIILIPYTVSGDMLPSEFWSRLAKKLNEKGYRVFTNTIHEYEVIDGTSIIDAPIAYIPSCVKYGGCAVSIQTGLADLLHHTKTPCIVIQKWGEKFSEYFKDCVKDNKMNIPTVEYNRHNMELVGKDPFVFQGCYSGCFESMEELEQLEMKILVTVQAWEEQKYEI